MLNINHNPWMGLASYDVGDADLFFGRDLELEKTNEIIQNNLSTIIYGESGVGKTSLIRAGLFPRLTQDKYLPVWIRLEHDSDEDYCIQIEHAILEEVDKNGCEIEFTHKLDQNQLKSSERLWLLLYSSIIWDRDNKKIHPVIIFDQFEEIFTLTSSSGIVKSFFKEIADFSQQVPNSALINFLEKCDCKLVPNDVPQVHFVYSLREDFLGAMEDAASECLFLFKNKIRIGKLNGEQALDAIVKPYPGLIDYPFEYNILKVLSGQNELPADLTRIEIEPTILSLYCSELYVKACEMNLSSLTSDLVLSTGTDVIYDYYVKSLSGLHTENINYIEKELLTKNGFRKQLLADDVDSVILPQTLIDDLINKRIIRVNKRKKVLSYEFTHDVLCASAKKHRNETNSTRVIRNKIFQALFWSYDIFLNTRIISLVLESQTFTHSLIQKPIELIAIICSLVVSLLMRAVNYASKGRVKWAPVVNLALSIFLVSELRGSLFESPYDTSLFINKFQIIILAILHIFISTFIKQNKCTYLTALRNLDEPIFTIPFKLFLMYVIYLFYNHATGQLNTAYMRWMSIIGTYAFSTIGLSFLLEGKQSRFCGLFGFSILTSMAVLVPSVLLSSGTTKLLYIIILFPLSYFIMRPSNIGLRIKLPITYRLTRFKQKIGISGYYVYEICCLFILLSSTIIFNQHFKNIKQDSAVIVVPEGREAYGHHYLMQFHSIEERRNHILTIKSGKIYQFDKKYPKPVLPTEYAEVDKIVTYVPAIINDDGTVRLSDYLVRVKKEPTDTTFSTVYLSDSIHLSGCMLCRNMRDELETYYHSSSSAKRRLYIHIQERNTDNIVRHMKEKLSVENDVDDIYNLKWLVLANRMKELLVLEESKITGQSNVNDLGEIFRKGLDTEGINLSNEFKSAMTFLTELSANPKNFTFEEVVEYGDELGLRQAIQENLDILKDDSAFDKYIDWFLASEHIISSDINIDGQINNEENEIYTTTY